MATATLNTYAEMNWGSDSEDDGDFNPRQEGPSDNEADSPSGDKPSRKASPGPARQNGDQDGSPRGTKRRRTEGEGDDDDEDLLDDDDEEDESDEDEAMPIQRKKKKKVKDKRAQFFDEEAEVDDDDEDDGLDDSADEVEAGFIADHHDDDPELARGGDRDDRHHLEVDRIREQQENLTAEQMAAEMAERARQRNRTGYTDTTNLASRYLMPGPDDPGMWMVKCRSGREKDLVREINQRAIEHLRQPENTDPFPLVSAFERDKIHPGHIYAECFSEKDLVRGLIGMVDVYPQINPVKLAAKDMPAMLRVKQDKLLEEGQYVRIKAKSGYQRDLAQVTAVYATGVDIEVRLVPRPRPHEEDMRKKVRAQDGEAGVKARFGNPRNTKDGFKYPQVLLTRKEADRLKLQISSSEGGNRFTIKNDRYEDGFLWKMFKVNQLITENVKPTLEEAVQFSSGGEAGTQNLDLKQLADTLKDAETAKPFVNGDEVEVFEGEQKGAAGRVVEALTNTVIKIRVGSGSLKGEVLDVQVKNLRKVFTIGQHVKVISGNKFKEEMGMVVKITDNLVTFTSDQGGRELTVFSKDLTGARDSGATTSTSPYSKHDLLQLDATTVGCVVRSDRDLLVILDQAGTLLNTLPSRISNNLTATARHTVAVDLNGQEIRRGDVVRERGGERRQGKIIHLHAQFAYMINSEDHNETDGLFVARTMNIESLSITSTSTSANLDSMNPLRNGMGPSAPNGKPLNMRPGRAREIGMDVRVKKGGYKGLRGIVKDVMGGGAEARIELHTKSKILTIPTANLQLLNKDGSPADGFGVRVDRGDRGDRDSRPPRYGASGNNGFGGGDDGGYGGAYNGAQSSYGTSANTAPLGTRTPAVPGGYGASTPFNNFAGGRTPGYGAANPPARTPAWAGAGASGGMTATGPSGYAGAYNNNAGQAGYGTAVGGGATGGYGAGHRTPAYGAGMGGMATSYGGGGNRTSYGLGGATSYGAGNATSYGAGNATSYGTSYGQQNVAGGGGTSYAQQAGSRTPAYPPGQAGPTSGFGGASSYAAAGHQSSYGAQTNTYGGASSYNAAAGHQSSYGAAPAQNTYGGASSYAQHPPPQTASYAQNNTARTPVANQGVIPAPYGQEGGEDDKSTVPGTVRTPGWTTGGAGSYGRTTGGVATDRATAGMSTAPRYEEGDSD